MSAKGLHFHECLQTYTKFINHVFYISVKKQENAAYLSPP
jgi:hypothetical protein